MVGEFTGGDPGIQASLSRMYREEGTGVFGRFGVEPEVAE